MERCNEFVFPTAFCQFLLRELSLESDYCTVASKVKDTSSDVDTNSIMTPTPKLPGFDELDGQKNNDETDRSYTENAVNGTIDALDTSWDSEESYGDLPIENDFSNSSVPPLGINIKPLLSVSLASTSKLELSHDTSTPSNLCLLKISARSRIARLRSCQP